MTEMKITVVYDPPPIPLRTMDYVAYEDEHSARGATAGEAVEALLEQFPEEPDIEVIIER
jgi:hypothetical protein